MLLAAVPLFGSRWPFAIPHQPPGREEKLRSSWHHGVLSGPAWVAVLCRASLRFSGTRVRPVGQRAKRPVNRPDASLEFDSLSRGPAGFGHCRSARTHGDRWAGALTQCQERRGGPGRRAPGVDESVLEASGNGARSSRAKPPILMPFQTLSSPAPGQGLRVLNVVMGINGPSLANLRSRPDRPPPRPVHAQLPARWSKFVHEADCIAHGISPTSYTAATNTAGGHDQITGPRAARTSALPVCLCPTTTARRRRCALIFVRRAAAHSIATRWRVPSLNSSLTDWWSFEIAAAVLRPRSFNVLFKRRRAALKELATRRCLGCPCTIPGRSALGSDRRRPLIRWWSRRDSQDLLGGI